jgi:hypothetical protein
MNLDGRGRAGGLVQDVDVLRHEMEGVAARRQPALQRRQGVMRGVGPRREHLRVALAVPRPGIGRVAHEVLPRRARHHRGRPDGAGIGAAERRDAARQADAGAREHERRPTLPQRVGELVRGFGGGHGDEPC